MLSTRIPGFSPHGLKRSSVPDGALPAAQVARAARSWATSQVARRVEHAPFAGNLTRRTVTPPAMSRLTFTHPLVFTHSCSHPRSHCDSPALSRKEEADSIRTNLTGQSRATHNRCPTNRWRGLRTEFRAEQRTSWSKVDGFLAITMNDAISCLATSTCSIKKFHTKSRTTKRFYPSPPRGDGAPAPSCLAAAGRPTSISPRIHQSRLLDLLISILSARSRTRRLAARGGAGCVARCAPRNRSVGSWCAGATWEVLKCPCPRIEPAP